ncbi:two-component system sensor histidine kinase MprB [Antricoccus suffuscus]|uniref:histidine kinase n=1 Tax=Antricoccus suffuscus TaxID=1629062 RepID=A0A2T1A5V5_9ACTN|nr:HAMP domain-containing sensor histidine kinase [Antricoccus suffuscus]PRZ43995.1 two-component system sensor histidine kinase MprB [Antricoccus suffuscus]
MSLRQKFVSAFAIIAAVVAIIVGWSAYRTTQHAMYNEINVSLSAAVNTVATGGTLDNTATSETGRGPGEHHDDAVVETAQSIATDGSITHLAGVTVSLPVSKKALAIAQGSPAGLRVEDRVTVGDVDYLVLTQSLGGDKGAVQVGRDLNESARVLDHLAIVTLLVGLGVLFLAAAAGWLLARRITRRLTLLAAKAETVSWDGAEGTDFAMQGRDEVGRLGSSLQSMVNQLSASKLAQQRLVQNAGHELRTPLTSLRTNVSVLRRFSELSPQSQQRLLDDVDGESKELTNLVNELIELAMDRRESEAAEPVDLAALTRPLAARFEHRSQREVIVHGPDTVLLNGRPQALTRAISNLLDNAMKFDTGQTPIEVTIADTGVEVCDRGPGLGDGDSARIFDRFYRTDGARSMPGSGLGLAIVAEVAAAHGGVPTAASRSGGGARIGFTFGPETLLPNSNRPPTKDEDDPPII